MALQTKVFFFMACLQCGAAAVGREGSSARSVSVDTDAKLAAVRQHRLMRSDTVDDPVKTCTKSGGAACAECVAEADRKYDDECAACNDGFLLNERSSSCEADPNHTPAVTETLAHACTKSGGASCAECVAEADRTADEECSACNSGFELEGITCKAVPTTGDDTPVTTVAATGNTTSATPVFSCTKSGEAACAECVEEAHRTADEECSRCNSGFELEGTICKETAAGAEEEIEEELTQQQIADAAELAAEHAALQAAHAAVSHATMPEGMNCRAGAVVGPHGGRCPILVEQDTRCKGLPRGSENALGAGADLTFADCKALAVMQNVSFFSFGKGDNKGQCDREDSNADVEECVGEECCTPGTFEAAPDLKQWNLYKLKPVAAVAVAKVVHAAVTTAHSNVTAHSNATANATPVVPAAHSNLTATPVVPATVAAANEKCSASAFNSDANCVTSDPALPSYISANADTECKESSCTIFECCEA